MVTYVAVLAIGVALVGAAGCGGFFHFCREHRVSTGVRAVCLLSGVLCLVYCGRMLL